MANEFIHRDGPFAFTDYPAKESAQDHFLETGLERFPLLEEVSLDWPNVSVSTEVESSQPDKPERSWPEYFSSPKPGLPSTSAVPLENDFTWNFSLQDLHSVEPNLPKTWESITDPAFTETCEYLSQAKARTFDLALRICSRDERTIRPVKPDLFLSSIFQLGLGRESVLFTCGKAGRFTWRTDGARVTGVSTLATKSIIAAFERCGRVFRNLRSLSVNVYRKDGFPPCVIALAHFFSAILLKLEIIVTAEMPVGSILHMQNAFKLPFKVLTLFDDVFKLSQKFDNDKDFLSHLFDIAKKVESSETCLTGLIREIVKHVSRPWLDALGACIGLTEPGQGSAHLLRNLENSFDWSATLDDEVTFDEIFPSFFSHSDRHLVMQIFQGMKVLNNQGKTGKPALTSGQPNGLRWSFTWQQIVEAESPLQCQPQPTDLFESIDARKDLREQDCARIDDSLSVLQQSLTEIESSQTLLYVDNTVINKILREILDSKGHEEQLLTQPTFEISAMASFNPILSIRAKEVNRACLQELFSVDHTTDKGRSRNLTYHLTVLRRYVLLENGVFADLLSQTLFDSSLASTERSEGHVRTGKMGLRLGDRSSWPPASSELQLALTGILTSSFAEDGRLCTDSKSNDLPGNLSFALRQLSEEEIESCLDPESLEALDFLKIRYTPPRPLDIVILPNVLDKYDQVLKLLLRLKRLIFVVSQSFQFNRYSDSRLVTNSTAFRLANAANHFVSAFSEYVITSAIAQPWKKLMSLIEALEISIRADERGDGLVESFSRLSHITEMHGIDYIRRIHDDTLDEILFACLLKQRHEKIRVLLEDNFRIILLFAANRQRSMDAAENLNTKQDDEIKKLYIRFKKQTRLFVQACEGLVAGHEYGNESEENCLLALVTRLTMNGFYVDKHS